MYYSYQDPKPNTKKGTVTTLTYILTKMTLLYIIEQKMQ